MIFSFTERKMENEKRNMIIFPKMKFGNNSASTGPPSGMEGIEMNQTTYQSQRHQAAPSSSQAQMQPSPVVVTYTQVPSTEVYILSEV